MNLLSFVAFSVFAAETVISPLPADYQNNEAQVTKPDVSFGQLRSPSPPEVLGQSTQEATVSPTPVLRKRAYSVAVLGDSMVDTLGPGVPELKSALERAYPNSIFTLFNYGVGGTNIDYGLERLTSNYTYLGNEVPALVGKDPNIVVVESFGYNPYSFDEGALDKHWLALASIVDALRARLPGVKIVIAATIAPDSNTFGDGGAGLAFSPEDKRKRTAIIKNYLENTIKFAQSQHLPLADLFTPSLGTDGNGKEIYINQGDHIHPSGEGRELFAQKVTQAIVENNLLE